MIITKRRPASRSQEVVEYDNGRVARLCYAPHNPHYFRNSAGKYKKIELFPENVKSKMDISLWDKNIVSMGLKRNGDGEKYIGYRPDSDQSGAEQLEFTLLSVKLDGEKQNIESGEPSRIDTGIQSLGRQIAVTNTRQGSKQCWRVERPIKDFEIRYRLNVKGMIIKPYQGEFWFYSIKTGEFRFRIKKPSILDDRFRTIQTEGMTHTLVKESGELIYKKKNLQPIDIKKDIYYIDAETCYSSTEDGAITALLGADDAQKWVDLRAGDFDFDLFSTLQTSDSSGLVAMGGKYPFGDNFLYYISRSFFMFDTSNVINAQTKVSLFVRGTDTKSGLPNVSAQEGTQGGTVTNADWNNFTGVSYGAAEWADDGWNEIEFNATGIANINRTGATYICCREYDHDFLNNMPTVEAGASGYFTDNTGIEYDPYLNVEMEWSHKIFGTSMFRSIMGIPRENIQSVMGIDRH